MAIGSAMIVGKGTVRMVVKVKIKNETKWDIQQLRKLCNAVINKEGTERKRHRIYIRTKTKKYSQYHGRAWLNSREIIMFVPPTTKRIRTRAKYNDGSDGRKHFAGWEWKKENTKFDPVSFAQVLTHEIHHNLGLRHKDMLPLRKIDCEYTKDFAIEPKQEKPKPKMDYVGVRRERAISNLKKAQTRLKRAKTLCKKWERKVRYYGKL